jgi:hypothetical protein
VIISGKNQNFTEIQIYLLGLNSQIKKVMTTRIPNLIIVAGDGRNSGKTSMCRKIIMESGTPGISAIKISPHFHDAGEGLVLISENEEFAIYEETNSGTGKDSSEMLRAGAGKVYYLQVTDGSTASAFRKVLNYIPSGNPIICESPSLINHFEPGIFIIMVSEDDSGRKDISEMKKHVHFEFTLSRLNEMTALPFHWTGRKWIRN